MYKVTVKNGSIVFMTIEDAMLYIVSKAGKIFSDGGYVKIYFVEDFE